MSPSDKVPLPTATSVLGASNPPQPITYNNKTLCSLLIRSGNCGLESQTTWPGKWVSWKYLEPDLVTFTGGVSGAESEALDPGMAQLRALAVFQRNP